MRVGQRLNHRAIVQLPPRTHSAQRLPVHLMCINDLRQPLIRQQTLGQHARRGRRDDHATTRTLFAL